MSIKTILAAAAALSLLAGGAHAGTLLTSEAGYTGPDLDLSGYDNGSYNFTFGPVAVGEFTFTAAPGGGGNSGGGSVVGQGSYGLSSNGAFGGDAVYIGVDSGTGYAQLLGLIAYSQIGFFFNYAPGFGDAPVISTLDAGGNVIESFDLAALAPISTPGGFNEFEFRGVRDDVNDIYGLRFGGSYLLASGTATGDIPGGVVPEPTTWALMILGFGSAGAMLRRRRLSPAAI
jgi:hypothetical protein